MSHFYFSNGRGLNVTQLFANVTHGDSRGDTFFFLKVSRDTTESAVLSDTSSHTRVSAPLPFLTFKKVSDRFSPVSWVHLDYKSYKIKYRVMGFSQYDSSASDIWLLLC